MQDGTGSPNWIYLNHNNSAADSSISLKFGTEFDHTFKVEESKTKVTTYVRIRSKTVTNQEPISLTDLKLCENFPICTSCSKTVKYRPKVELQHIFYLNSITQTHENVI